MQGTWSQWLAVLVIVAGLVPALKAQDGENTEGGGGPGSDPPAAELRLDDTVVIATTGERSLAELPYTAYTLGPDDLELRQSPRIFPESLSLVPGVLLQKTGNGMTSPFLRGVTSQRTLLLADGVRVNNATFREGPNQYWSLVDGLYYDDLEVLMGPGTVIYGSEAVGGVVLSRKRLPPRGPAESGTTWQGGHAYLRAASAERSLSEHLEGNVAIGDDWSFNLGITRQDFGDLRTGEHEQSGREAALALGDPQGDAGLRTTETRRQPNTGFQQWGFNLRGVRWFTDDSRLVFGFDHFDQDNIDRVHRTYDHVPHEGTLGTTGRIGGADDQRRTYDHLRHAGFARYELRDGTGGISEADVAVTWQQLRENFRRVRTNGDEDLRETVTDSYGLRLRLESPSPAGIWTYGGDWYRDYVDSEGLNLRGGVATPTIQGQVADDATYDLAGVFVQNELPLGERFELLTGARFQYARLDAGVVDLNGTAGQLRNDWSDVVGSGRLLSRVLPDNRLNVFVGASQGFRAPNLSDATRAGEFGSSGLETPTAGLDAEEFTTYEVGAKSVGAWGQAQIVLFQTNISGRIYRLADDGTGEPTKRNLDDGRIHGFESQFRLHLTREVQWYNRLAWAEGQEEVPANRTLGNPIVERPMSRQLPFTVTSGLRWQTPGLPVWLEGEVVHAEEQGALTDAEQTDNRFPPNGTPGWTIGNLRGGWQATDALDLTLGIENITDEAYRVHGSGVSEPGLNVVLSAHYSF